VYIKKEEAWGIQMVSESSTYWSKGLGIAASSQVVKAQRKSKPLREASPVSMRGQVFMVVRDSETKKVIHTYDKRNLIVYSADLLAAELLSNEDAPGISHLAIGTGLSLWNPHNPPPPDRDQLLLEQEIHRVAVTAQYIDPDTGDPVNPQQDLDGDLINRARTWLVDFSASIGSTEAIGALKEMGLFGGVAAADLNKGTMINFFTFPEWNKVNGQELDIIWRISFRHTEYIPEFGTCAVTCQTSCQLNCMIGCMTTDEG